MFIFSVYLHIYTHVYMYIYKSTKHGNYIKHSAYVCVCIYI